MERRRPVKIKFGPLLVTILSILAVGCVTLVTLVAVDELRGNKGGSAAPQETPNRGGRWGAANRDRLALCVDGVNVPDVHAVTAVEQVELALSELENDPLWPEFNAGFPAPVVQNGCPVEPSLYDPNAGPYIAESFFHVRGRVVTTASYFYAHVFILPEEEINRFGSGGWRFTDEESFCWSSDSCSAVTFGLYLSSTDIADPEFVRDLVAKLIGLRSAF